MYFLLWLIDGRRGGDRQGVEEWRQCEVVIARVKRDGGGAVDTSLLVAVLIVVVVDLSRLVEQVDSSHCIRPAVMPLN